MKEQYSNKNYRNTKSIDMIDYDGETVILKPYDKDIEMPVEFINKYIIDSPELIRLYLYLASQSNSYIITLDHLTGKKLIDLPDHKLIKAFRKLKELGLIKQDKFRFYPDKTNDKYSVWAYNTTLFLFNKGKESNMTSSVNSQGVKYDSTKYNNIYSSSLTENEQEYKVYNGYNNKEIINDVLHEEETSSSLKKELKMINEKTNNRFNSLSDIKDYINELNINISEKDLMIRHLDYIVSETNEDIRMEQIHILIENINKFKLSDGKVSNGSTSYTQATGETVSNTNSLSDDDSYYDIMDTINNDIDGIEYLNNLLKLRNGSWDGLVSVDTINDQEEHSNELSANDMATIDTAMNNINNTNLKFMLEIINSKPHIISFINSNTKYKQLQSYIKQL